MMLLRGLLVLALLGPSVGAPQGSPEPEDGGLNLETYDPNGEVDWENLDLDIYRENYDYDDLDQEIEVGTLTPLAPEATPPAYQLTPLAPEATPPAYQPLAEYEDEVTLPPKPTPPPAPVTLDFKGPGLFGPETGHGMPTCILCVCISGSVYCDDTDLEHIPPLPKDTTHFYGRFNRIRYVKDTDFINLSETADYLDKQQIPMSNY